MINLAFYTPKGEILKSQEVVSVTLPSSSGIISVYDDHKPLISLLSYGEVEIEMVDGSTQFIFITSGIVRVEKESHVVIMADTSEFSSDIDVDAAHMAKQRAEELLKSNEDLTEVEFAKLQSDIERELMKIEVGRMRKTSATGVKVNVTKK